MERLSDLAITKIAGYLSPRDLVTCSAVCKKWREKFNIDSIWKPHVQFTENYYKIQERYKEMIFCPSNNQSLDELCASREHYIRDQCLRFNCRAGLFTVEQFKPTLTKAVIQLCNMIDKEGNYWLFLNTLRSVEVWNITNKPYFQSSAIKTMPTRTMYVVDTKVVLVLSNFVQVYAFEYPKYQLELHSYFFIEQDYTILQLQHFLGPRDFQLHTHHILNGNTLIGYSSFASRLDEPSMKMHLWKLDTMVKIAQTDIITESLRLILDPNPSYMFRCQIHIGDSTKLVIFITEDQNNSISFFLIYDIERLRFLDFIRDLPTPYVYSCNIISNYVIIYGCSLKPDYFINVFSVSDNFTKSKMLSKSGIPVHNTQFAVGNPKTYIKTPEEVLSVEIVSDVTSDMLDIVSDQNRCMKLRPYRRENTTYYSYLRIASILKDDKLSEALSITVINPFILTMDSEKHVKIWDLENRHLIRDVFLLHREIDVREAVSLKDIKYPPKIICTDFEKTVISVLSFW